MASDRRPTLIAGSIARRGRLTEGWIELEGAYVSGFGTGAPPRTPDERHDGVVAPGFCDLQVNGAGGYAVTDGPAALDVIDRLLLARGVTSYLPTLITSDEATIERALADIAPRVTDPGSPIAGVHLEGPFLAAEHAGAHRRALLRAPADRVPGYYESPAVRLVTLAPELPGALDLIERLRTRNVTVSLGHSGASAELTTRAIDTGATLVTHLFNAMAPLHHRSPGIVGAALSDRRVRISVIADRHHVDALVLELVNRLAGPRVVLVSDASPAADAPPGRYELAGAPIESAHGTARTRDGGLGGSAITLDAAVRTWSDATGASLAEAIAAAAELPAAVVGLPRPLNPGSPADLVLLDGAGVPLRVMRRGEWMGQSPPSPQM